MEKIKVHSQYVYHELMARSREFLKYYLPLMQAIKEVSVIQSSGCKPDLFPCIVSTTLRYVLPACAGGNPGQNSTRGGTCGNTPKKDCKTCCISGKHGRTSSSLGTQRCATLSWHCIIYVFEHTTYITIDRSMARFHAQARPASQSAWRNFCLLN